MLLMTEDTKAKHAYLLATPVPIPKPNQTKPNQETFIKNATSAALVAALQVWNLLLSALWCRGVVPPERRVGMPPGVALAS